MSWLNLLLLILAGLLAVAALLFALSALRTRSSIANEPYGVGRQESRREMQVAFFRAAVAGIVALILFGVYGLSFTPGDVLSTEVEATSTSAATAETLPANVPAGPTVTATLAPSPSRTSAPTATATATTVPTETPTSVPSAVVDSEVGLYLRPTPGSDVQLELLPNGTQLTLLPGLETVDDTEWQQVRAPSGNEGWVAVEFITYQQ